MELAAFAERARAIEAESADTDVRERVTDLLGAAGADLPVVARYVQGRVFPAHDSTKLDIGPALCYEAIAKAAGRNVTVDDVEERVADVGDVGEVASGYDFGGQRGLAAFGAGAGAGGETGGDGSGAGGTGGLTVAEVDDELRDLAATEGSGSRDTKRDILFGLFNRTGDDEARYLARLVLSEMRIGVGDGAVRDAIADAFDVPVDEVERALQVTNDHGEVAVVARDEGLDGLESLGLEVGRPVGAMLAQAGTVTEALDDWEAAAVEWKFDGARVQVHHDPDGIGDGGEGPRTRLFSRNMEDVTDPLPEVVEFVEGALDTPAILDGEVVAVADDGSPLPFQEVLRRFRRKHDVAKAREDTSVEFRAFDCLHADGDDLLDDPLTERHDRLESALGEAGAAALSALTVSDDPDEIAAIEAEALDAGHEGIMLKNPGSAYTPGRRGKQWLKRKPDVETLDLVVTGAEWGEGRRAELLGTFEISARTDDGFAPLGKVATGITDEELEDLTDLLEPHVLSEDGADVDVDPAVVFEVGYEEIQASPTYAAGYALRFPRFLGVRDDIDPDDTDSLERVERLAERQ
ncbi:ATP-dependent DNA ligase LigA [Halosimplex pelagicum]|uniref:DNA ligase n=1 Tax=Halosimplex pelagicum TaxID=869886 RepID=A0A7D5PD91_9EURY|nr:ATP-dependent DNA ligase LigA [Halosimplex pelagicum]QLH83942.1 ATP-dependent DNA ligase [Halosimplex pelagicum]